MWQERIGLLCDWFVTSWADELQKSLAQAKGNYFICLCRCSSFPKALFRRCSWTVYIAIRQNHCFLIEICIGWFLAACLRISIPFIEDFCNETHLSEHFGRTNTFALITCPKRFNGSGCFPSCPASRGFCWYTAFCFAYIDVRCKLTTIAIQWAPKHFISSWAIFPDILSATVQPTPQPNMGRHAWSLAWNPAQSLWIIRLCEQLWAKFCAQGIQVWLQNFRQI